ncbi:hypothetical protein B0H15DRAFT_1004116 [Mycena belliarum]|uniref:Uncharacterized protein n=1 Tax=Mycena belliarum TaxID=1033014 RepID=A0AAD6XNP2_9AGAR|nr:hypothetical protein B0H15DRAFT_1004116 [Mycena belliae]
MLCYRPHLASEPLPDGSLMDSILSSRTLDVDPIQNNEIRDLEAFHQQGRRKFFLRGWDGLEPTGDIPYFAVSIPGASPWSPHSPPLGQPKPAVREGHELAPLPFPGSVFVPAFLCGVAAADICAPAESSPCYQTALERGLTIPCSCCQEACHGCYHRGKSLLPPGSAAKSAAATKLTLTPKPVASAKKPATKSAAVKAPTKLPSRLPLRLRLRPPRRQARRCAQESHRRHKATKAVKKAKHVFSRLVTKARIARRTRFGLVQPRLTTGNEELSLLMTGRGQTFDVTAAIDPAAGKRLSGSASCRPVVPLVHRTTQSDRVAALAQEAPGVGERGVQHIKAQLTAEEQVDILTNIQAASAHLDFAQPENAPPSSASTVQHAAAPAPAPLAKQKKVCLLPGVVLDVTPAPDPKRWLKKSERSNFGRSADGVARAGAVRRRGGTEVSANRHFLSQLWESSRETSGKNLNI